MAKNVTKCQFGPLQKINGIAYLYALLVAFIFFRTFAVTINGLITYTKIKSWNIISGKLRKSGGRIG